MASPPPVFYLHHGPPTFPGMLISESKGCGYPAPGTAEHPLPELTAGMSRVTHYQAEGQRFLHIPCSRAALLGAALWPPVLLPRAQAQIYVI